MSRVGVAYLLCFLLLPGLTLAGTIELSVPDTCASQGDTLWLPIYTTDVTDSGVLGYDLVLKFDTTMILIDSVTSNGTISEIWGDSYLVWAVLAGQDTLRIAHAGLEPLAGSGILLRIGMHILEVPDGSSSEVSIPRANMRDDPTKPPTMTHPGSIFVPCGAGVEDEKRQSQLLKIHRLGPSHLRCSITNAKAGFGPLRIFDVHGHLVTSLTPVYGSNDISYSWKGVNASQRAVAAGVYFFEIATSQRRWTGKVAILR